MKERLKPFDVSIVSAYLGRFQTGIVALLVIGLTVHAFITRDSARGHVTLTMAVSGPPDRFEPLARIVSGFTGRSVELSPGAWDRAAELYIMPPDVYFEQREALDLVALFAMAEHPGDRALIVGARQETVPPSDAGAVLFTSPTSVNGCWVQLLALSRRKARVPGADSLRFEPAADGRAVAWAVHNGLARFGACRQSDLPRGGTDAVNVLFQAPGLADLILASTATDRDYFLGRLARLPATFDSPADASRDAVELLRSRGVGSVRPVSESQIKELGAVHEFVAGLGLGGGSP